jgi:hypothetical protein
MSPTAQSRFAARSCRSTGTPWAPAGGDEEAVAAQLLSVIEHEHVVVAVAPRGRGGRVDVDIDPVAAQHLAEGIAEWRRFMGQHVRAGLDEGDLAAESTHRLRHLDTDRSAAEHEQLLRHDLHPGHLTIRPDTGELTQPRHGRNERIRAVREHDVLSGVAATADLDAA